MNTFIRLILLLTVFIEEDTQMTWGELVKSFLPWIIFFPDTQISPWLPEGLLGKVFYYSDDRNISLLTLIIYFRMT